MKRAMILAGAAVLMTSVVVSAQPRWKSHDCCDRDGRHQRQKACPQKAFGMQDGTFGMGRLLAMADEINLTDAQKDKLQQMMVDFNLEKVDQQAKVKKAKIKLHALMQDQNAKETEVNTAIDALTGQKAELQKMRYRHHQAMRNLLTDEQKAKLKELRQEKRQKMRDTRPGRGQGGPGYGFDSDPDDI